MDWHKTYISPERLYALNQEKWEMYIHVKFKLCILRNRFLNISNKDHVGIHYHILHWSMCYIFITRKACKTNHTLWIMPCFSRQICKVLSQTFPSAGGRRKQRLLQHSPLSILSRRIPLQVGCVVAFSWNICMISAISALLPSSGELQLAAGCSQGCLAKVLGFSASGNPPSFSLTILHSPRPLRNKINWFFCPPPNKTWSASDAGMGFWQLTLFYQVIYN